MSYRIEVSEILPAKEGERYPTSKELYKQTVDELNLQALIAVVNNLSSPGPTIEFLERDIKR